MVPSCVSVPWTPLESKSSWCLLVVVVGVIVVAIVVVIVEVVVVVLVVIVVVVVVLEIRLPGVMTFVFGPDACRGA